MSDPYASHLPILLPCIKATTGPILELGIGIYSTPALHNLCINRMLVSVDTSATWLNKFEYLMSISHRFDLITAWNNNWWFYYNTWDIAFVDTETINARVISINKLLLVNKTKYIIVHDTEENRYEEVFTKFKYRYDYKGCMPYTTIVSNLVNPNTELKGLLLY